MPGTAARQLRVSHFQLIPIAPFAPAAGFSPSIDKSYAPAAQEGMQLNVDYLSPSDKLWLQAAYEKVIDAGNPGNKIAKPNPSAQDPSLDPGAPREPALAAWNPQIYSSCALTGGRKCEQQWSFATGGCKNYWLPFASPALFGSSLEACGPLAALSASGRGEEGSNPGKKSAETGFSRSPVKGLDLGAEYMYARLSQARPASLAPDSVLPRHGLPAFSANPPLYGGRLRVQGAF